MPLEKYITTRELLRSFKKYKEMLLSGKVMHVIIVLKEGNDLVMTLRNRSLCMPSDLPELISH